MQRMYFIEDDFEVADQIDKLRKEFQMLATDLQRRHDEEIKSAVVSIEPRYRNYPVMHREDL